MSKRHLKAKFLGSVLHLIELEKHKLQLNEKLAQTTRVRIMFDLPMDGAVGVHRRLVHGQVFQKGEVEISHNGKVVHEIEVGIFDRFDQHLAKARTQEEFDTTYRELVSEYFTGQLLKRRVRPV